MESRGLKIGDDIDLVNLSAGDDFDSGLAIIVRNLCQRITSSLPVNTSTRPPT
jgi:hypothetical protein